MKISDNNINTSDKSDQIEDVKNKTGDDLINSSVDEDIIPNFSAVTPAKKVYSPIGWLILFMILIGIIFLSTHHRTIKEKKLQTANTINDVDETLKNNMNALHKNQRDIKPEEKLSQPILSNEIPAPSELSANDLRLLEQAHQQALEKARAMQARFGAPTSLINTGGMLEMGQGKLKNIVSRTATTTAILAGNNANSMFANQNTEAGSATASLLAHPEATIAQGEFIPAVLETPINSDLPGMVRAVTSQPVYAYTGMRPIIPAGARLIGQYSSGITQGQSRVMVVWNRVLLPNGVSAQLNSPGTDDQGISGQTANRINRHFWTQFGQATLLSILGAGAANVGVNGSDEFNSAAYYRTTMSQSFSDTASKVVEQNINIKPTLIIHQGAQINVFVARDLDFYTVLEQGNN